MAYNHDERLPDRLLISIVLLCVLSLFVIEVMAAPNPIATEQLRLVTAGSSIAETVVALGAESTLVGVDTTSTFPQQLRDKPQVGYHRALSAEGVLSLSPTHLVVTDSAGPPAVLDKLRALGVNVVVLSSEPSLDRVKQNTLTLGQLLHKEEQAHALWQSIQQKFAAFNTGAEHKPRAIFLLAHAGRSPAVAGLKTTADTVMKLANIDNIAQSIEGYQSLGAESLATLNPDVIIITSEGLAALGGMEGLLKQPGIITTQAGKNRRIVALDSDYLLGFGPRIGQAIQDLHHKTYAVLNR